MSRCRALYSKATLTRHPRARAELERDELVLVLPDGTLRRLSLNGCRFETRDAERNQRFVRHLALESPRERADLITPPDEGAIAPRAARLPRSPDDVVIIESHTFDALVNWLTVGGRLSSFTVAELARLACIATPQFAVALGELAAKVAAEMIWETAGPMRGGADVWHSLRPLQDAARSSPRAADALFAALAASAAVRAARRRRS